MREGFEGERGQVRWCVAGYRQPLAVHVLAHAINAALGNIGKTVELIDARAACRRSIAELAAALNAGASGYAGDSRRQSGLQRAGGFELGRDAAQGEDGRAARVLRRRDACGLRLAFPLAHYLESWGDALTSDGTLVPVQPLICAVVRGLTDLEFLARLAGCEPNSANKIVRETFAPAGTAARRTWKRFLHDGFLADGSAAKSVANAGLRGR